VHIVQDPHSHPMSSTSAQLVQYVVVRGDLLRLLSWPTGAVIAQACHASTAILWMHRNDSNTLQYTTDLDNMHKVILEVSHWADSNLYLLRSSLHSGVSVLSSMGHFLVKRSGIIIGSLN